MNVANRIMHREAFCSVLLSLLILIVTVAVAYATPEPGQTYTITTVRIKRYYATGDVIVYATIKLQFPEYIVIDRNTKIYAYLDRSGCLAGYSLRFTVAAKINTVGGGNEYELTSSSFSLDCNAPASHDFELVVPKSIYDLSIDKTVTLYVKSISVSPTDFIGEATIVTNTPVRSYLVYGVPQPIVSIRGVDVGYLNLSVGESRDVTIAFTSMYAPTTVVNINATLPDFVSLYVNTPLPLNIGANQSMPIVVTVRGEKPGAGVVAVNIYYYTGAEVKQVNVYIPVVCEESRIYDLINRYRQELDRLRQEVQSLENQLGIHVDTAQSLAQRLNTISQELNVLTTSLNSLASQYASAIQRIDSMEGRVNSLENRMSNLENKMNNLENEISETNNSITLIIHEINNLRQSLQELRSELNEAKNTVFALIIIILVIVIILVIFVKRKAPL